VYAEHPVCKLPSDSKLKVWRYVDLGKLLDLLDSKALFSPLMSVLAGADPYEGFLGQATIGEIRKLPNMSEEDASKLIRVHEQAKRLFYVSCWHMNEQESAAMWSLYIRGGEGLAIQTTLGRLIASFADTNVAVFIGAVEYIDHQTMPISWVNVMSPILRKRASFEHEHELRVIVSRSDSAGNPIGDEWGARVAIRVEDLVERIVVAPTAPGWLGDLVERIVRRLGYHFPVERSPLLDRPVY